MAFGGGHHQELFFFFVQDLLLISSIVCCLLSMLQPRLIVYIVNKDFCRFNKLVTYLAPLEQAVDGGYFTDIPPNVGRAVKHFCFHKLFHFIPQILTDFTDWYFMSDCFRQTSTGSKLLNFPSKNMDPCASCLQYILVICTKIKQ